MMGQNALTGFGFHLWGQHDMFSFEVPTIICRELLHKFLKTSSLARQFILPEMADQILMLLEN
jgi:hypothetical protein